MDEKMYKLAIEAIDNLIVADEVEDDLYADALMVKQFMKDTADFLDSVGDDMAAMTSAYDSLHDRYVQTIAENEALKAQARIDKATINASLSSIHAAHDNR
jgi:citrate synthase